MAGSRCCSRSRSCCVVAGTARGGTAPRHSASARAHHCKRIAHRRKGRARCRRAPARAPAPKAHANAPAGAGPPASGGIDGTPPISSPGGYTGSAGAAQAPPEAGSPEPAPPSVPHVQVTAVEYGLTLSRSSVPAGKVVLELVNRGQDEHNLNAAPLEGPLTASIANTARAPSSTRRSKCGPAATRCSARFPTTSRKA